jgi:molecular chaperone Hsp33
VVECNSDLQLRATAKLVTDAVVPDDATLPQLVNVHQKGRFVITLDPKDKLPGQQPYQGIVPLDGDTVATVIENYMLRSEQLDTKLWLAADEHVARGLLLQKLPKEGGIATAAQHDVEAWNHIVTLGSTVKKDELLSTDIQTMMRRLFWEETIRLFDPTHPSFHCTCSREKVGGMLKILGKEEVDSALADLGSLSINCDFCGQHYEFDAVDCAQLFVADASADVATKPPGETRH